MGKGRVEAFSDGVLAIIITIMVLDMKVPHGHDINALKPVFPVFISYILSFINIGIYWNNHHHMMHAVKHVNGKVLWANIHLLFWLSLIPFTSGWMGENNFTTWPIALYGVVLFMAGMAYYFLVHTLIHLHGRNSALAMAFGKDQKGKLSVLIYFIGIMLAFVNAWISLALYALVAAIWFIPDKRIEKKVGEEM
jgi:uncharacterized membrane protein